MFEQSIEWKSRRANTEKRFHQKEVSINRTTQSDERLGLNPSMLKIDQLKGIAAHSVLTKLALTLGSDGGLVVGSVGS